MPVLFSYTKKTDSVTTHTLRLPQPEDQGQQAGQELATLADGRTVVVLFDGYTLPANQPAAIASSIEQLPAPLPDALKNDICAASPHVRLINDRVVQKIRDAYSAEQEVALLRSQPSDAYRAYNAFVESCRAWGATEKSKLGLRTTEDIRKQAVADVHREHDQLVQALTGNVTTAERASWPVKMEIAKIIQAGGTLDAAHSGFLTSRGLTSTADRAAYAATVMSNNTKYSAVLGLADKVRSDSLARINAATPTPDWAAIRQQNEAQRDAALAAAMAITAG